MSQVYEMFNDIADEEVKATNRARVMVGILENSEMTMTGLRDTMAYLHGLPKLEQRPALRKLSELLGVEFDG